MTAQTILLLPSSALSLTFEEQVSQFLKEHPAPIDRDVLIDNTNSLLVTRWKNLWFKAPEPNDYEYAIEGYLKAYALGYLDELWIHESEIITLHVESMSLEHDYEEVVGPEIVRLWNHMREKEFYLADWTPNNIVMSDKGLKVIDWGGWTHDEEIARWNLDSFLFEYFPTLKI